MWNIKFFKYRLYTEKSCKKAISIQNDENRHYGILKFTPNDHYGWLDTFIDRKQFVFPSLEDIEKIFDACSISIEWDWYFFLQEPLPDEIGEDPMRLVVCYVYISGGTYRVSSDDNGNCHNYIHVRCGVFPADENETMEASSDAFYAGWKIPNKDIILSKGGFATITIEQTIPLGCDYRADNSLVKDEIWTKKKYTAQLSSIDSDYDDKTAFDLELVLTYNSFDDPGPSVIGEIHVDITDINRHWSKRCYSHVDPHMKTVDGIHYEAQREGDYMLYLNEKFQTEVQTSARYCRLGYTRGPVCACGIAIAVGADLFVINRCHDQPFKFDLSCGDGGLIDIEHINDYRYLVRTPIGTMIEILLWGNVMNIDVYMSAKDFGNVAGLCGNFDGDRSNDLEHRDGTISDDNNRSYKFADSWRLTDEENLFINTKRKLDHWNVNNVGQTCARANSITRNKCKISKRQRRLVPEHSKMNTHYQHLLSRKKRAIHSFTEDEAFQLCNHSIYTTPAVQEFPDHLAGEDPDVVVEQCVYDLTQGNDTAWIDAHVTILNNAADTILRMSPVYVANNTDKVNSFRSEICMNNCSGKGICTDTGLCACNGIFRGPDCSIDISIPPVVIEIEGGGVCTITDEDDCTCFQISTDNIFDGFMCNITEYTVYSNGSRMEGNNQ
ncbi:uncharacterized protein LOC132732110 [Ruditapes philippinarum]|uniref:uncharacterized protein LOC132732110 n=1 Tax=Ruditapes philippinarum TaxID=129788 RepID=UPI00295B0C68|nr:uncharacterized protein LOC132732110 [Ruditapes philippinarum]